MEDFSTIVWVVFIVFSLVANYAGRKQKKAGQQHREEAWPGDRDDAETREEATEWPGEPILRPATRPMGEKRPAANAQTGPVRMAGERSADGRTGNPRQTILERQTPRGQDTDMRANREYTGPLTPKENAEAPASATRSAASPSPAASATARQGRKNRQNSARTADRGQRSPLESSLTTRTTDSTADDQTETRIAEEFDLRRAIVYAEILKPKFAEFAKEE